MILESQHITKNFGNYRALDDVSIGVREGVVFGLLGPNGAGKTTFIRLINRILRPDDGRMLMDGRPMTDDDVRAIGYLPEERGLYKKMKVGEQAVYLARLKGLSRSEAEDGLREWFRKFDIADWWNRPVEQLSKGMQQKVQFIVTVLHRPRLLIFDEPFSGFDPVNAALLKNEILELRRQGATVILSTHNMASVEELCDDIALINNSHVVLSGNVHEIRRSYSKNMFRVVADRRLSQVDMPEWCHVVTGVEKSQEEDATLISVDGEHCANQLIAVLVEKCNIVSFSEMLPSMNDIFIESVGKKK